ncbi:MAG: cupin domain-containing protein [Marinobacter sp.]|uniref:cupin domain-containing protein n=1 Tax=Marinobacter sp. TaxID=50741 RepID=UPI00299CE720|nr:cupin domain-containing protein [Marinobacter sp.]MDX1757077.1 cupin domain-containing protein [Marinobacter sp.]
MNCKNLHDFLPHDLKTERFDEILHTSTVRIERIVSKGHRSPETGWYDQDENEWVLVLQGSGVLTFDDGSSCRLSAGDYINIPAHRKHKVSWTDPAELTFWLAVFYR